jgi:formate dehydrogenase subunit gamma
MTSTNGHQEAISSAIDAEIHRPGALLPILHAVQDRIGHVPDEAIPIIAKRLNLSRAEVHGVVTFYPHYRSSAPGRHVLQVCMAEACQAMGADRLVGHIKKSLAIDLHQTTRDGYFSLEPVYCLGNCACSPSMMVDEVLHGRVSPNSVDQLVDTLRKAP